MKDKLLWKKLRVFEQASIALALATNAENYCKSEEKVEYEQAKKDLLNYIGSLKCVVDFEIGGEG